jgi:hypothetical protein
VWTRRVRIRTSSYVQLVVVIAPLPLWKINTVISPA